MKIGILSDTHGWLHPDIPVLFKDVDLILHAGDVGNQKVLDTLAEIAPLRTVYGNIDGGSIRRDNPEMLLIKLDAVKCCMIHIGGKPTRWAKGVVQKLRKHKPQLFICGHSHILQVGRVKAHNNMLFINPGAAGREGFHLEKTCMRIEVEGDRIFNAEVIYLDRK